MLRLTLGMLLALCALFCACVEGEPDHPDPVSVLGEGGVQYAAQALVPTHLPCEIETVVRTRCKTCHVPLPNRPVPLETYADFAQPSKSVPNATYAQQALQLVQTGMMPPSSSLSPEQIQQFAVWVQAGAPSAECGAATTDAGLDAGQAMDFDAGFVPPLADASTDAFVDAGPVDASSEADAFGSPTTCTSNKRWTGGDMRSELMHPGRACINCHTTGVGLFNLLHGPTFTLAGTLFPSAHEPDDCNGAAGSDVTIVVTGATGQTTTLTPNSVGNFHSASRVTMPYTVEIQYQGRVRAMKTPQRSGDCNSCHTEKGMNGAPGRIMLP
jgi:hypothetical protein